MPVLDFPDAPTVGQIFIAGSKSWTWTGAVWNASEASGGGSADNALLVGQSPITYNIATQTIGVDQSQLSLSISQITDYVVPENYTSQVVSTDTTLVKNVKYFVDTTAARSLTLPATPALGDEVLIFDASGLAETNHITVLRNGSLINGTADDAIIDINQSTSIFTYAGSTIGWSFG